MASSTTATIRHARLRRNATAACWMAAGLLWLAGIVATPWEGSGGDSDEGYLREIHEHPVQGQIAAILLHFGFLLVVPALFGSLAILHGRGRALGYTGVILGIVAFATLPGLLITDFYGLALMDNLSVEQAAKIHAEAGEYPWALALFLPTFAGSLVGVPVAMAGLWRARAIPWWVALVSTAGLLASQFTPATLIARSASTLVLAVGFSALAAYLLQVTPAEWAAGERMPRAAAPEQRPSPPAAKTTHPAPATASGMRPANVGPGH